MKNFYSLIFCLTLGLAHAQIPGTFSFQGVARDAEGNILANNNIEALVAISSDIDGTNVLYNESHATTTNAYGVFSLEVGNGSGKSGVLEDVDWGSGDKFIRVSFRPEEGQYGDAVAQKLLTVPYALYAKNVDNVDDADADSTNELQTLSVNDSLLSISSGNTVKLTDLGDGFEANTDEQTLELTDGTLSITGGNEVDISVIDNDEQTLSLDGADLTISNGNTVDLGVLGADTDDQAIDVLGLNGTNLELSLEDDGEATRTLDLSPINTDNQLLGLSGDNLTLTNGGSVDLSGYTNSDNQSLSYNASTDVISLTNGGTIDITEVNTDNQALSYNASTDEISIGGGNTIDITEVNTDNQTLSYNPTTDEISIGGGNTIDISEVDTDTDTDDQTLSYNASTDVITIVDGNSIDITEVNTDNQTLTYNPTTDEISIGGGNTIDISEVDTDTDTDDQTLSYNASTDVITIADGNSIDITEVNTDNQTLTYNPTTDEISIGGGNTIDISEVDTDTDTDDQTLSYNASTDVITIADGNSIDITEVNTDGQTLSFNSVSDQLTIAGGNTVGLSGVDDQTLSFSGTTLTIAGGNSVNLSSLASSNQSHFLGQITTNYRAVALDGGGVNYGEGKRIDFDKVEIDLQGNYDPDKDIFRVGEDAMYQISWNLQLTSIEGTVGYIFMVVLNSNATGSVAYLSKESGIARDVPFTENGSITLYLRGGDEIELVLIESGTGIEVNSQVFGATINDDGTYNNDPGNGFVDPRMNYVQITQLN